MNNCFLAAAIAVTALLAVEAAAQNQEQNDAAFETLNTVVEGRPVSEFDDEQIADFITRNIETLLRANEFAEKSRLIEGFRELTRSEAARIYLDGYFDRLESSDVERGAIPEAFKSISGFSTVRSFRAFLSRYGLGKNEGEGMSEGEGFRGKITEFLYLKETMSGRIVFETLLDFSSGVIPASSSASGPFVLTWEIIISPSTFIVSIRNENSRQDSKQLAFPTTGLSLPNNYRDPGHSDYLWGKRNLTHKLYAKGAGIVVEELYLRPANAPPDPSNPYGTVIKDGDPLSVYKGASAESCIDILFSGYPPRSQLPKQLFYCLGRCANPPIVNSR